MHVNSMPKYNERSIGGFWCQMVLKIKYSKTSNGRMVFSKKYFCGSLIYNALGKQRGRNVINTSFNKINYSFEKYRYTVHVCNLLVVCTEWA